MFIYIKKNVYNIIMVNYKCPRCGYETHIKTIYVRHLGRKIICNNTFSNNDLMDEYKKFNIISKLNTTKMSQNEPKFPTKMSQNEPVNKTKIKKKELKHNNMLYECVYCNKKFKHIQSLNRHKKGRCKTIDNDNDNNDMRELVKLLNDQLKEQQYQIKEQNNQIKEQNNQIKELIKKAGITNINIQNNIKLLSYGNTDVSHLTDNDYMKCLNHSNFCVPHLIEKIHFNPQKPENHNIYISNIKNNYVMLYDGNKWILKDRDDAITNLMDEKEIILEQKLEEWIENGNDYPKIMNKFKRYIDKKENNKVLNKIKDEIKLVLFNNRQFVEKK